MEATLDKSKSSLPFPVLSAEEAAEMVNHNMTIGFSGFTPAGAAKAIPRAIAAKARSEHEAGRPFQIGVLTGASTGASLDGELAKANAVAWRTPYQSDSDLRALINKNDTNYFDMHLSVVPQYVRYGFFGKVDFAVVEACDVTADGEIILTTSVGVSPTYCRYADKIIVELNSAHPAALRGIHDIYEPLDPPARREIPVYSVSDRIGSEAVKVDPKKIVGIVHTNIPDEARPFKDPDDTIKQIGVNVAEFLAKEMHEGRIPKGFLPIQSGVGNIANAVLGALGDHPDIPAFDMYSEVIQDSVVDLMLEDKIKTVSGTSLSVSNAKLKLIYDNLDEFRKRIILRPQEISNNPEVARRIGVISINTAIEVDIFGNINSTHILGKSMMNGIGGSGDFTRSAYLSIFTCPSVAKGGKISAIVPQCSHIDHSEHSVQAVITEQGYANLRCKNPKLRAEEIIDKCVNPSYKDILNCYCKHAQDGYTPQTFGLAYGMHEQFLKSGDMHDVDWKALTAE